MADEASGYCGMLQRMQQRAWLKQLLWSQNLEKLYRLNLKVLSILA